MSVRHLGRNAYAAASRGCLRYMPIFRVSGNATTVSETLHLTSYDSKQGAIDLDVATVSGAAFNPPTNLHLPSVINDVSLSMDGGLIDASSGPRSYAGGNTEKEAVYKLTGRLGRSIHLSFARHRYRPGPAIPLGTGRYMPAAPRKGTTVGKRCI